MTRPDLTICQSVGTVDSNSPRNTDFRSVLLEELADTSPSFLPIDGRRSVAHIYYFSVSKSFRVKFLTIILRYARILARTSSLQELST